MDSTVVRIVLIAVVVLVAAAGAYVARRGTVVHPPIDISGAGFSPGLVVFTSTACRGCKPVLEVAKQTGAPLREVTFEIEAALQERVGVTGVPLTVVVGADGNVAAQFAGDVKESRLRRALRRAGV